MRIKYLIIIKYKIILKYIKNKIYKLMRIKIFNHTYLNILN